MEQSNLSPTLSIIIVSYNTCDLLDACLDRITASKHEIIVVDNASNDGSVELCRKKYPSVKLLCNGNNTGFARANNLGEKIATGQTLLFLNSDTLPEVVQIDNMLTEMLNVNADILGPCLIYPDGRIQRSSARKHLSPTSEFLRNCDLFGRYYHRHSKFSYDLSSSRWVESISGAALMVTKTSFDKIGGWAEEYFMYAEDDDFCWKARLLNLKIRYYSDVKLVHYGSSSSKKTLWLQFKTQVVAFLSLNHIIRKHYGFTHGILHAIQIPLYLFSPITRKLARKYFQH